MIVSESKSIPPAAPGSMYAVPSARGNICCLTTRQLTVVDHDWDGTSIGNIDEELLQSGLGESAGVVTTRNDDGEVGTGLCGLLSELNSQLGSSSTAETGYLSGLRTNERHIIAVTHVPAIIGVSFNPFSSNAFLAALINVTRSSFAKWWASPMEPQMTGHTLAWARRTT